MMNPKRNTRPKGVPPIVLTAVGRVSDQCPECGSMLWTRPYYPYPFCHACGWQMLTPQERAQERVSNE